MRKLIWRCVRSKVPEGERLPWWAIVVRAALAEAKGQTFRARSAGNVVTFGRVFDENN